MNILYHHRTLGDGAEGIHVAEIVRALEHLGHSVRVEALIGRKTNIASTQQRSWKRVAALMPGFLYELGEIAYNLPGSISLARAVREFRPDAIYDRYASYSYAAVGTARRMGLPVLLEVNSPYSYQRRTFDEKLYFGGLLRLFERNTCRDATQVLAVSTPLKEFLCSIGIPPDQVVVLPNGVDPDVFHPHIDAGPERRRLGLEGKVVVGFTGILRPWHGLELLLAAFASVAADAPELHLLIVGDGPFRSELEREVSARRLSTRVTVTGRVQHHEVAGLVAAMDITVSPRATYYSSPMKILEYMAMAKTVLAPDMANIRDLIAPGEDGVLFTAEEPSALATRLDELRRDAALRVRLGQAARAKILAERTWRHNAQAVVRLFEGARAGAIEF